MRKSNLPERNAINFLAFILVSLLGLIGFSFSVFTYWDLIIKYWFWIALFYLSPVIIYLPLYFLENIKHKKQLHSSLRNFTLQYGVLFVAVFGLISYGLAALGFYEIYLIASSPGMSEVSSLVLVGFVALALGTILFYFRLKWRFCYGLTEAVVGVIVASQRFYSDAVLGRETSTAPVLLAILTAGVYLVVRGADNMHQGLVKEPLDPIGQKVIIFLRKLGASDMVQEFLDGIWITARAPFSDRVKNDGEVKSREETS